MPYPDFSSNDDIPDMRIPERSEGPLRPVEPVRSGPIRSGPVRLGPAWRIGDRVLAPWEPQFLYSGRVAQIEQGQLLIEFDDGDAGWVAEADVQFLVLHVGQHVVSRRRMGPAFYPGVVAGIQGEEITVRFDDGSPDETTRVAALRIACQEIGPGARPVLVNSHTAFRELLQTGDRVWAPWMRGALFVGTVDKINGHDVHIHFDDGDRGWVQRDQLFPLVIPVGLRVMGRWKMGNAYYPGTVTVVEPQRIRVEYDDGDKEWTRTAALAIAVEPTGPDARPTRTAFRWSSILGWLIPVALVLVWIISRNGCR